MVVCNGTETDQQGSGFNEFVDITINGTATVSVPVAPVFISSSSRVTLNGTATGPTAIAFEGFSEGPVDLVNSELFVAPSGLANGIGPGPAVSFGASGGVLNNRASVAGRTGSLRMFGGGAISGNSVSIAAGGEISTASPAALIAVELVGDGVAQNTLDISGRAIGFVSGQSANAIVLRTTGSQAIDQNTIRVRSGGRVEGQGSAISLLAVPSPNFTGPLPSITNNQITVDAGGIVTSTTGPAIALQTAASNFPGPVISGNTLTIAGSVSSASGIGILLDGGYPIASNTINISGSVSGGLRGLRLAGPDIGANSIVNSGTITGGVEFEASTIITNNILDNSGTINAAPNGLAVNFVTGVIGSNTVVNRASGVINGNLARVFFLELFAGSTFNGSASEIGLLRLKGPGVGAINFSAFSGPILLVEGGSWTATGNAAGFAGTISELAFPPVNGIVRNGASLNLNGAFPNALLVSAGGTLSGNASTGQLYVNGTASPGNSIGTINVTGPLSFASTSTYVVEVGGTPIAADRIIAAGPVSIAGGTVTVSPLSLTPGVFGGARLPIVTGSSVSGTFAGLSAPAGAFQSAFLEYSSTDVFLNLIYGSFADAAESENQRAVADVLDDLGPSHEAYDELLLLTDPLDAARAFESLSGAGHPSAFLAMEYVHELFTRIAQDRLTSPDAPLCWTGLAGEVRYAALDDGMRSDASSGETDEGLRMWGRAFGGYGFIEAVPSVAETDFKSGGIAMGLEKHAGDAVFGLGVGFAETEGDVGSAHDFNIETVQFQAYAGAEAGRFELLASLGAGRNSVNTERTITVGLVSDTARANYDGWTIGASGEAGFRLIDGGRWRVTPFAGVDYTHVGQEGFTEFGSALGNLTVDSDSTEALRAVGGVRIQSGKNGFLGTRLAPQLRVAYAREFLGGDAFAASFASNPTAGFVVDGAEFGKDRLMIGAGAGYRLSENAQFGVGYDGDFSKDDQSHALAARLRVDF